jgi:hypothetical protein
MLTTRARRRLARSCYIATLAALSLSMAVSAAAQARERVLIVSAIDKAGRPAASLSVRDVVVREDGMAREVLRVAPVTEPMQVAILVDNSEAVTPHVPYLRDALGAFVEAIGDKHEISFVTYGERPTLVVSFAADRKDVTGAIGQLFARPGSGAYLLDAILETAQGFIKRESPRPVMVVVATDEVEFSHASYEVVLERLAQSGAQLHVIQLVDNEPDETQEERYRSIVIDRGTRDTGGRRENLLTNLALPDALTSLASELNHQFRVVYARPDSLIPPAEVRVSSATPDLEVRGIPARQVQQ